MIFSKKTWNLHMDQDFVGFPFRRIVSVQDDLAALSVVAFKFQVWCPIWHFSGA